MDLPHGVIRTPVPLPRGSSVDMLIHDGTCGEVRNIDFSGWSESVWLLERFSQQLGCRGSVASGRVPEVRPVVTTQARLIGPSHLIAAVAS